MTAGVATDPQALSEMNFHWPRRTMILLISVAYKIPREMIAENYFANEFTLWSTSNDFLLIEVHYLMKKCAVLGSNNSNYPMQSESGRIMCFHNFTLHLLILKCWRT